MKKQNPNKAGSSNRFIATGVLSAALVLTGNAFADDCSLPERPAMPDGSSASMEQMLEGQKSVKAFQSSNMDYMKCLEDRFNMAQKEADSASDDTVKAEAQKVYTEAIEAYNAAVSAEEEVAGDFNVALRAYRAANK